MSLVLNVPAFWITLVLNMPLFLNLPGFQIHQGSEYARVNRVQNMPE